MTSMFCHFLFESCGDVNWKFFLWKIFRGKEWWLKKDMTVLLLFIASFDILMVAVNKNFLNSFKYTYIYYPFSEMVSNIFIQPFITASATPNTKLKPKWISNTEIGRTHCYVSLKFLKCFETYSFKQNFVSVRKSQGFHSYSILINGLAQTWASPKGMKTETFCNFGYD